ncbi:MAG: MaoC family dehydratase [Euzebyales bacterium]|nr:MaoC family dehydratase [Euzebyales bacterium]MBA3621649.1 MaoC family dehydratase [Euzebyales bacterium]
MSATPASGPVERDWQGRFFEDFAVGTTYQHAGGRTVEGADNIWFTLITNNNNELHFNSDYAAKGLYGRRLVNSCLTLAIVTGLTVPGISRNAAANLGWDEVRLPAPVFEGDTLYARSTVQHLRPSRSRPETGVVRLVTEGYNQDGTVVITFRRAVLVYRRGAVDSG